MIATKLFDMIYNTGWSLPVFSHADDIHQAGARLPNSWGFVDGTVRPICRPGEFQKIIYNGHHRVHALKSIECPNGLIADLYGPSYKVIPIQAR